MLGTLYFAQRIIQLLFQKDATLFLILGAATQVYFVRMGVMVMTDALCGFLVLGTFYHYFRCVVEKKNVSIIWMLGFATLAFFSRYASIPLIVIPVVHAAILFIRKWNIWMQITTFVVGLTAIVVLVFSRG